jgi:hypothetical protein
MRWSGTPRKLRQDKRARRAAPRARLPVSEAAPRYKASCSVSRSSYPRLSGCSFQDMRSRRLPIASSQPDRASFVALLASRIGAHVGWRCSVAAPESAIEIREVAETSFERDRTHSPVGKPRIDQHSMCPIESLDQYEF